MINLMEKDINCYCRKRNVNKILINFLIPEKQRNKREEGTRTKTIQKRKIMTGWADVLYIFYIVFPNFLDFFQFIFMSCFPFHIPPGLTLWLATKAITLIVIRRQIRVLFDSLLFEDLCSQTRDNSHPNLGRLDGSEMLRKGFWLWGWQY